MSLTPEILEILKHSYDVTTKAIDYLGKKNGLSAELTARNLRIRTEAEIDWEPLQDLELAKQIYEDLQKLVAKIVSATTLEHLAEIMVVLDVLNITIEISQQE